MSVEREMSLAEWCAKLPSLHLVNQELSTLNTQLAALAEQNAKMRESLIAISIAWSSNEIYSQHFFNEALSLPDLTTPVLNRIRAEGMKLAAEILDSPMDRAAAQKIIAKAAELEKTNG